MVTPRELVHRLLHRALIDIRADPMTSKDSVLYHLADLFEPVPVVLERVAQGEGSYDEALGMLQDRAEQKGIANWLANAIRYVSTWSSYESGAQYQSRNLVYHLLYVAILEMRAEAYALPEDRLWCLLDTLHHAPLELERAFQSNTSFEALLVWIRDRAQGRTCETWLNQAIQEATT